MKKPQELLGLLMQRTPIMMFVFLLALSGSWKQALVVVAIIVAHELNHAVAFRILRVGLRCITFHLFMAATHSVRPMRSHVQIAVASLAGPAGGLAQAGVLLGLYQFWPSPGLLTATAIAASINLFNCAPVLFVDGGGVWKALISRLHKRVRTALIIVPILLAVGLVIWFHEWITLIILAAVIGLSVRPWVRFPGRTTEEHSDGIEEAPAATAPNSSQPTELTAMPKRHIAVVGMAYAGTIAGLLVVYLTIIHTPGFSWAALR